MNKNKTLQNIIKDTLLQKDKWLSMDDSFAGAFGYALKELHKKDMLITSSEFSLSHLKTAFQAKVKDAA